MRGHLRDVNSGLYRHQGVSTVYVKWIRNEIFYGKNYELSIDI